MESRMECRMDYKVQKMATVRFVREGFHHWPDATPARRYLAQRHRHLFHVEASIEVRHSEREIEFHDFLKFCREHFGGYGENREFGPHSCEALAEALAKKITLQFPNRSVIVKVFEDGEVGAQVNCEPDLQTGELSAG